jgi:hypothetical protein
VLSQSASEDTGIFSLAVKGILKEGKTALHNLLFEEKFTDFILLRMNVPVSIKVKDLKKS